MTRGILVGPPTITTLPISEVEIFASSKAFEIDGLHLSTIGLISSSSLERVNLISRFFAPDEGSCAINGKLMSVSITVDNSIFAFSDASLILVNAVGSLERSNPSFFLNSSTT